MHCPVVWQLNIVTNMATFLLFTGVSGLFMCSHDMQRDQSDHGGA